MSTYQVCIVRLLAGHWGELTNYVSTVRVNVVPDWGEASERQQNYVLNASWHPAANSKKPHTFLNASAVIEKHFRSTPWPSMVRGPPTRVSRL